MQFCYLIFQALYLADILIHYGLYGLLFWRWVTQFGLESVSRALVTQRPLTGVCANKYVTACVLFHNFGCCLLTCCKIAVSCQEQSEGCAVLPGVWLQPDCVHHDLLLAFAGNGQ